MKKLLNILGVITLVGTIILSAFSGMSNGGFFGFFGGLITGIIFGIFASAVFFGLAAILNGQENIMYELHEIKHPKNAYSDQSRKQTCPKCQKAYDPDYSSCPYCGFKG